MARRPRMAFDRGGLVSLGRPARQRSSPSLLKKSVGADALRAATKAEKLKMRITSKGQFFVRKGTVRFTKRTPRITERQQGRKETGLIREKASKARRFGGLDYKTAAARETAGKSRDARLLRRVESSQRQFIPSANPSRKHKGRGFKLQDGAIERFERNRALKLRGEEIPDGEWHEMMDIAAWFNDARIAQLRLSPKASFTIGK